MKVLVTGGFGYLGGRFSRYIASQKEYQAIVGTRNVTHTPSEPSKFKIVQTNWSSASALAEICMNVDAVVHMAGMNAQECAADPINAIEINAVATARLMAAAVSSGVKRFIYLSTAHVYGSPLEGIITEESCPRSLHPYATSHRAGEDVVRFAHQRGDIDGIVVRLSNAFGAPIHEKVNCWMLLVNDLCQQAAVNDRMVLHSTGMRRRDFISITDVCSAITHLLELPTEKLINGLFNVGGDWAPTILEMTNIVAERIHHLTGSRPEVITKQGKPGLNVKPLNYNIDKLISTGFKLMGEQQVYDELDALIRFSIKDKVVS